MIRVTQRLGLLIFYCSCHHLKCGNEGIFLGWGLSFWQGSWVAKMFIHASHCVECE
jgi:hypothetical protein